MLLSSNSDIFNILRLDIIILWDKMVIIRWLYCSTLSNSCILNTKNERGSSLFRTSVWALGRNDSQKQTHFCDAAASRTILLATDRDKSSWVSWTCIFLFHRLIPDSFKNRYEFICLRKQSHAQYLTHWGDAAVAGRCFGLSALEDIPCTQTHLSYQCFVSRSKYSWSKTMPQVLWKKMPT